MASILGAALTPFVATWLAAAYGPRSVGVYLAGLGFSTLAALETMEPDAAAAAIEATSP